MMSQQVECRPPARHPLRRIRPCFYELFYQFDVTVIRSAREGGPTSAADETQVRTEVNQGARGIAVVLSQSPLQRSHTFRRNVDLSPSVPNQLPHNVHAAPLRRDV